MEDHIKRKIEQYTAKLKAGLLNNLEMAFITDTCEMPLNDLINEFNGRIEDYFVEELNLNKINKGISLCEEDEASRYPTNKLYIDGNTIKLIEKGKKIIPSEIIYIGNEKWQVFDGQL